MGRCGKALKRAVGLWGREGVEKGVYLEVVYLVTALVPSLTACLASSPGSNSLTAVCRPANFSESKIGKFTTFQRQK